MCTVRTFLNTFAPFLGSQLRGNRVLCAQFVHFFPYLQHFLDSQLAVTACWISYHICIFESQLCGNRVLCAQFAHFIPYLHRFWAPNYAETTYCAHSSAFLTTFATACCAHSSCISQYIAPFLGSQLHGNRVLCAQFVHFLPYLHPRVHPTPPGGNEFTTLGNSPLKGRIHRQKVDIHCQKGRYPIAENNIHRQKGTYSAILPKPALWQCMMTCTAKKGRGRRCTKHDQKSECFVTQAFAKHADSTPQPPEC